ncbi:MAG: putative sulfate exporter family transporter [Massilia sp.]
MTAHKELAAASPISAAARVYATWRPAALQRNWPGLVIGSVIALAATFVSTAYGGPQLLYALFFGLAFHFLANDPVCRPGIDFCCQTLLRTGVAMLGARVTFEQLASLGVLPLSIAVGGVLSTIAVGCLLAFVLGRTRVAGLLSGGAVAICGASAALAISAVLPRTRENEQVTLLTIVGVTALSTVAMVLYPLLARLLGLDATAAGIFIGATIHDVAQVIGAGYLISNHTGEVATLVKLTRVACLVPVVVTVAALYRRAGSAGDGNTPPVLPMFLIGFMLLMGANSLHLIPAPVGQAMGHASRALLVMAIAALGVKTSFQSLAALGWRPVAMLVGETVWLALFSLTAIRLA